MSSFLTEFFGYLASLLLGLSLIVNNDLRFRWLNTGGCAAFIAYGLLIDAFPVILTNAGLLLLNGYALLKIYKKKEDFDLLEFGNDAPLVRKFLGFYEEDIKTYFPAYETSSVQNAIRFVVLRDAVIANAFVATLDESGTATVQLNYTVPKYRDYKVGRFIFEKEKDYLLSKGVKRILYTEVANKKHLQFLSVMGFEKTGEGYEKKLA